MTTVDRVRPSEAVGSFGRVVRSEWTKLRSVPRWMLAMLSAVVLTVLMSVLAASGSGTDSNAWIWEDHVAGPDGAPVSDDFHFVHQPVSGDVTLTARVVSQEGRDQDGSPTEAEAGAAAGLMIKQSAAAGSAYAAIVVTPGGVRMHAAFTTVSGGGTDTAPHWLRLTRAGSTVTGYESPDGTAWTQVGAVQLADLPDTAELGMFVTSPDAVVTERQFGSTSVGGRPTLGAATFDHVNVEPAHPGPAEAWHGDDVGRRGTGRFTESEGKFTVIGSGDIAAYSGPGDDVVQISLVGFMAGVVVIAAVGVLFITAEYKRDMIRTSFIVSPRRGRVLAAKAIVMAGSAFAVGLVAAVIAFQIGQPILRQNGFEPPAFAERSLSDPIVWRALFGSAALFALAAVFSLSLATILRRSAAAIALSICLMILPLLIATGLPPTPAEWLMRLTPAGGFAMQRILDPTPELVDPQAMISSLAGLGVLTAYTVVAFAVALRLLNRRDA